MANDLHLKKFIRLKAFTWLATASLLLLPTETLPAQSITVHPTFKADGLLRNPATGWMLYMQTLNVPTFLPSEQFWSDSKPFLPFVSILYLRCTWAQMEPQEGHYAWQEDANFQALVKGAQERGLKLAFRVIINSRDCLEQATPKWVQDAGAQGTMDLGFTKTPLWSGSPSNPIVRQKLAHFISAFAQEFDDPSRVDFIDGCGLGWWGEMHHPTDSTNTTPDEESRDIFEWSLGTYSNAFHHVLLCLQVSSALALHGKLDAEGYQKYGYVGRIDNVGSAKWFTPERQQMIQVLFPTTPFLGEVCYFPKDPAKARPILETAFHEGIENHADVLSLRQPEVWLAAGHDLVQAFIAQGGYRLYPSEVIYPSHFPDDRDGADHAYLAKRGRGRFPE